MWLQAHGSGLLPREWLLLESILNKSCIRIKADRRFGGVGGYLEPLRPGSGGIPQGLVVAIDLYALLPQDLDDCVSAAFPPPCCAVHPVVFKAF